MEGGKKGNKNKPGLNPHATASHVNGTMIADDDWVFNVHSKYTIDCVLGANTLKNHPYCAFQAMNCANILILYKTHFL